MAEEAYVSVPWAGVGKVPRHHGGDTNVEIYFYDNGKISGTLKIGRARAVWKPPKGKRGYKLTIVEMAKLFEKHGW